MNSHRLRELNEMRKLAAEGLPALPKFVGASTPKASGKMPSLPTFGSKKPKRSYTPSVSASKGRSFSPTIKPSGTPGRRYGSNQPPGLNPARTPVKVGITASKPRSVPKVLTPRVTARSAMPAAAAASARLQLAGQTRRTSAASRRPRHVAGPARPEKITPAQAVYQGVKSLASKRLGL